MTKILTKDNILLILGWFTKQSEVNNERVKTFTKVCQKYEQNELKYENLSESSMHYVYSNKLKVLGCTIQKSGSTTLQRFTGVKGHFF